MRAIGRWSITTLDSLLFVSWMCTALAASKRVKSSKNHRIVEDRPFCAKRSRSWGNFEIAWPILAFCTFSDVHGASRIPGPAKRVLWSGQGSSFPIGSLMFWVAPKAPELPSTRVTVFLRCDPTSLAWSIFREDPTSLKILILTLISALKLLLVLILTLTLIYTINI